MTTRKMHPRGRFWLEVALSSLLASLTVLTLVLPGWVETVSRFSPDSSNGGTEWTFVAMLGGASMAGCLLAGREWRRALVASTTLCAVADPLRQ